MQRRVPAFALCAALAVTAGFTHAAPSSPQRAQASAFFVKGDELYGANDFAGAERAFQSAYDTLPKAVVLLKIADCQLRQEKLSEAIKTLERYLKERPDAPDRANVQAHIAEIRLRPGAVQVSSTPAGATITVDGRTTTDVTPATLQLTPGLHSISLSESGYTNAEDRVTVEFGGKQRLALTLTAVAAPPPAAVAPATTPTATAEPSTPAPVVTVDHHPTPMFWTATGVAGAGVLVGTIFGIVALNDKSDFNSKPSASLADSGERAARIADVGWGVAVVASVTAGILYFTSGGTESPSGAGWSMAPAISPGHYGVVGVSRF